MGPTYFASHEKLNKIVLYLVKSIGACVCMCSWRQHRTCTRWRTAPSTHRCWPAWRWCQLLTIL